MRKTGSQGLYFGGVFRVFGRQHGAARNDDSGKISATRQGHHHRRKPLIAGGYTHYAFPSGQRANQPAHHNGCIIPIGKTVIHTFGPLRSTVARIAAESGKGKHTLFFQGYSRLLDQQADLPMAV
jgi:hypothetical protein